MSKYAQRLRAMATALLLWAVAAAVPAAESSLECFFRDLDSLSAAFEQTLYDAQGQVMQSAVGRVSIQRPGRFRWDYTAPNQQLVLGDGARLWTYDAELEQATVKPQDATLAGTPALLLSAQQPPSALFDIQALAPRDAEQWYALTPHAQDTQFSQLRLGFRDDVLVAMELIDAFEQLTQIRFSDLQRNVPLAAGLFDFTPPDGVDVIGDTP
ncbi:MAG: outer membrane lipoprotein chaperone LolA [Gammaproteobacteria bacterium]